MIVTHSFDIGYWRVVGIDEERRKLRVVPIKSLLREYDIVIPEVEEWDFDEARIL